MSEAARPSGLIEGSGHAGTGRELRQMVSARVEVPVVAAARAYAAARGLTVSEVIRAALLDYLAENAVAEEWCALPSSYTGWPVSRNATVPSVSARHPGVMRFTRLIDGAP